MSTDITTIGIAVTSSDVPIATDRLAQLGKQGKDTEDATGKLSSAFDRLGGSTNTLAGYIKIAAEAFAAWKIADFVKDTVLLAARYETLGVVMQVIGNNAGYTGEQMLKFQAGLQKTGISAVEARQGLALMGQAQVDMTKSSQLARVAQDAAVIANTNSSDAFNRMMTGISTGQAIILHHMGLMVNFEKGYKTLGDQLGKTKEEMTTQELTQARVAEVMRVSTGIAGSYEAAMGTVGKAMNSLKRFVDDAKVSFGLLFTPALGFMVEELTGSLKGLGAWFQTNKSSIKEWGNSFKDTIITIAAEVTRLSMLLDKAGGSMTSAGMLLFGPGSALGNAKSKKQFERLAAANMEYEKRYSEGESRLQSMAGKMSDVAPNGGITVDPAEAGRMAAHAARVAEEAAAARKAAAEKAAADALELAQKQAAYQKQLDDAKTALARINAENAKKLDESIMKEKLAGFQYEKDMGLKTTQEFLDEKYALEKAIYQKEVDDAVTVRNAAQGTLNNINSNPVTDLLMQIQAQEKLAQATGKVSDARQKLNSVTSQEPRDDAKNLADIQRFAAEMANQKLQLEGATLAAADNYNALKYVDLKKKGYTDEAISLQKKNDALLISNNLETRQIAITNELYALDAANSSKTASMVGVNPKTGTIDSISDQTAHDLAVQKDAYESQMAMIEQKVEADKRAYAISNKQKEDELLLTGKLIAASKARALADQENANKTAKIGTDSYDAQLTAASKYTAMSGQLFTQLAATQNQNSKSGFDNAKMYNEAAAVMNTAAGIMSVWAQPSSVNFYEKLGQTILVGIAGAVQVATIASQTYTPHALNGYDIPAGVNPVTQLHEQEMVLPKAQANVIRDLAKDGGSGSSGGSSKPVNVTNVYQISTGVADTVRAEVARLVPMITQQSVMAVQQAINSGGSMSAAVGRR